MVLASTNYVVRWSIHGFFAIIGLVTIVILIFLYLFLRTPPYFSPKDLQSLSQITFFALGDQGTGNFRQWVTAYRLSKIVEYHQNVHFGVLLGDSFYPNGVSTTEDLRWRYAFENMYRGDQLDMLPFYAVLGNHDVMGDPQSYIDYSTLRHGSGRWQMPDRHYVREFGQHPDCANCSLVRIVFLDTTEYSVSLDKETRFLYEALVDSTSLWRVVVGHHPIRNFGRYRKITKTREALQATLIEQKVDIYLSGHDHNQQLIWQENEPLYLISGNGGKRGYEIQCNHPSLLYCNEGNGFSMLTFTADSLTIELYDQGAGVAASFTFPRRMYVFGKSGSTKKRIDPFTR